MTTELEDTIEDDQLNEIRETVDDWLEEQLETAVVGLQGWIETDLAHELHERAGDALSEFEESTGCSPMAVAEEIGLEDELDHLTGVLAERVNAFNLRAAERLRDAIQTTLSHVITPDLGWR